MTDHASCPNADGVICAATLDDAAADPALTLEGAREMLRDAAAAIRHFHGLAPPALSDDWARTNVAAQQPAGDGCHCATCTCEPNMTPALRFDLSPAQKEGAIREHLIRLGWTPPDEHATAPLQAEIEALRAEVERVTCELMGATTRADKLAEALRGWWKRRRPVGWTEDQHRACPHVNLTTDAEKALATALLSDQEEGE